MNPKKGMALLLGMPHDGEEDDDADQGPSSDDKQKAAEDTAGELGEAFKAGDRAAIVAAFKRLCQLTEGDGEDEAPEEG